LRATIHHISALNDSIAETFELKLKEKKVDSTITILYDYDNGRLPNSKAYIIFGHIMGRKPLFKLLDEGVTKYTKDTNILIPIR
jgi:hypothetical protein